MNGPDGVLGPWLDISKKCAVKYGLNYDLLTACVQGDEGTKLYHDSVFYTSKEGIHYDTTSGIPVIRIEGKIYQGLSAYENLGTKICSLYNGTDKPSKCGCSITTMLEK